MIKTQYYLVEHLLVLRTNSYGEIVNHRAILTGHSAGVGAELVLKSRAITKPQSQLVCKPRPEHIALSSRSVNAWDLGPAGEVPLPHVTPVPLTTAVSVDLLGHAHHCSPRVGYGRSGIPPDEVIGINGYPVTICVSHPVPHHIQGLTYRGRTSLL